ncbi:hypothetical protein HPC49_20000 [Pyxidicoccus fallax]|uniref:DUF6484 domain-containing protein n=1 Tax=Pyxidicoccus fallax TaxID=394095 RepID=A0A848L7Z6_9BACT|nr:DUF6484 domain-containing protein [Pyxidicoccus fallax]NMO14687.1 hypothetical protein [Pyxidicoccus fallax]NPC80495.1 hypothetical protein [Pyxidicoccus fallax]
MTSPKDDGRPAPARAALEEALPPSPGLRIGQVVGVDADGEPLVELEGSAVGPLRTRRVTHLDRQALQAAVASRQSAVLLFEEGCPTLPILLGLVHSTGETPLIDAVLEQSFSSVPTQARVDGRQVVIEGREEVILQCGKARLTLKRDGQVLLRGVTIRTEAQELHRIKGGKVKIN